MAYEMHVYSQHSNTLDGWDISELVHNIEYTTSLSGQSGKLTFIIEKDPSNQLQIAVGNLVKFWSNNKPVFYGYVFTIGTDKSDSYRVVCYDQMRYLKQPEIWLLEDGKYTLPEVFEYFCGVYGLKYKVGDWVSQSTPDKLEGQVFNDNTAFEILQSCIDSAMRADLGGEASLSNSVYNMNGGRYKYYYIKDNFGVLELREIFYDSQENINDTLIIGDGSLLTNYEYEVSIDKETYNEVALVVDVKESDIQPSGDEANEDTEVQETEELSEQVIKKQLVLDVQAGVPISGTNSELDGQVLSEATIPKWGILKTIREINDASDLAMIRDYAKAYLEVHNKPTRKLTLNALGYDGIFAGTTVFLQLNKLDFNCFAYVKSATHYFNADIHTMELEVIATEDMNISDERTGRTFV